MGARGRVYTPSTVNMFLYNLQPTGLTETRPTRKKLNQVIVLLVSISSCEQSFEKGQLEHHSQAVWYGNEATNPQETEL